MNMVGSKKNDVFMAFQYSESEVVVPYTVVYGYY